MESSPLLRFAKKRIVGWPMPTHIVPVVALDPAGSSSDERWPLPPTFHGSLPATIFAPPFSVQPAADSALPPGATTYWNGSSHCWKTRADEGLSQFCADLTSSPACAGAAIARAAVPAVASATNPRLMLPMSVLRLSLGEDSVPHPSSRSVGSPTR